MEIYEINKKKQLTLSDETRAQPHNIHKRQHLMLHTLTNCLFNTLIIIRHDMKYLMCTDIAQYQKTE